MPEAKFNTLLLWLVWTIFFDLEFSLSFWTEIYTRVGQYNKHAYNIINDIIVIHIDLAKFSFLISKSRSFYYYTQVCSTNLHYTLLQMFMYTFVMLILIRKSMNIKNYVRNESNIALLKRRFQTLNY